MSFYNTLQKQTMTMKPEKKISKVTTKKSEALDIDDITPDDLPLEFVKQYLRVDHDFDDIEIQLMINSAKSYVRNTLRVEKDEELDAELMIPMLSLIAYFYETKTITMASNEKANFMFESILALHRKEIL